MPTIRRLLILSFCLNGIAGCVDAEAIEAEIEEEIEEKCEKTTKGEDALKECTKLIEKIVEPAADLEPEKTLEIVEDWDIEDDEMEDLGEDLIDMLED